jgi:hypothetical protein
VELCGGQRAARSGATGGSPELSLVLALVAPSPRGFHLQKLWRTGILTEVFVGVSEFGCKLATEQVGTRKSARLEGLSGAPPTSVLLQAAVTVTPLPQRRGGEG